MVCSKQLIRNLGRKTLKRLPAVVFAFLLLSTGVAFADDAPIQDETPDQAIAMVEVEQAPTTDGAQSKECRAVEVGEDGEKVFQGFGPHCSTPFTCTIQEPGLAFGCTCTYQCSCAYCNGQLTTINCQLIDDGGCFSCPS